MNRSHSGRLLIIFAEESTEFSDGRIRRNPFKTFKSAQVNLLFRGRQSGRQSKALEVIFIGPQNGSLAGNGFLRWVPRESWSLRELLSQNLFKFKTVTL